MLTRIPIPIRISAAYLVFGSLWILLSGNIARQFSRGNVELLNEIESFKGIVFVLLSAILILLVSIRPYRRLTRLVGDYKLLIKKNKAIHTASREGIYEFDFSKDKVVFNENLSKVIGATTMSSSNARTMWKEGIHPSQRDYIVQAFDAAEKEGRQYWQEEYMFKVRDGLYKDVLHSVYFIKGKDQQLYSMVGAVQDLTRHRQLERQYHEQQLKQKLELARTVIQTEEKEKNRWAEELHDNIAQVLGVAGLYCGMLKYPDTPIVEMADKVKSMIDLSIQEIRHLSANLKPPRFDQGLKHAIEALIANIKRVSEELEFHISCANEDRLSEEQKLMVYRIIQEQIHNTLKYASATNVGITMRVSDANIGELIIADDGRGFDPNAIREGIGLKNIRSRLEIFQGQFELISSSNKGCKLRATFDVINQAAPSI